MRGTQNDLVSHLERRLSPEARDLWLQIEELAENPQLHDQEVAVFAAMDLAEKANLSQRDADMLAMLLERQIHHRSGAA